MWTPFKKEEWNKVKRKLLRLADPIILPITRKILAKYYLRDKAVSLLSGKRVLILAPHVDDETIGLGGTIAKHVQQGDYVACVYMTDGAKSVSNLSRDSLVAQRKKEAFTVKRLLGINELHFLNLPDGGVENNNEVILKLMKIIGELNPEVIYSPTLVDCHVDHIATTKTLADILKKHPSLIPTVRLYEVNCPIPPDEINYIVDISCFYNKKNEALAVFTSQAIDFDGFIELSKLKTSLARKEEIHAVETFLEFSTNEFISWSTRIDRKQYQFDKIFKQVNKASTLLWGILKNQKLKQQIYMDCKQESQK